MRQGPRETEKAGGYERIYAVVRRIPRGCVATYGQVAALAGLPGRARFAGYALYALPAGSALPWHRVLNAQGRLSLYALDPDAGLTQRMRLEREGVRFDARGRIDLERHQWRPGRSARVKRPGRSAPAKRSGPAAHPTVRRPVRP